MLLALTVLLVTLHLVQPSPSPSPWKDARLGEGVSRAVIMPKDTASSSSTASKVSPLVSLFPSLPPSLKILTHYCNTTGVCPLTQITHERTHYHPANITRHATHTTASNATGYEFAIEYTTKAKNPTRLRTLIDCSNKGPSAGSPAGSPDGNTSLTLNLTVVAPPNATDGFINYIWTVPVLCRHLRADHSETDWVEAGHKRMIRKERKEEREKVRREEEKNRKAKCCPCK